MTPTPAPDAAVQIAGPVMHLCTYCKRPRGRHWRRRLCGPLTGTGPGPMTPAERERYLAATR